MSKTFKALEEIGKPDVTGFVVIDSEGNPHSISLADEYGNAESLELPSSVPENVRLYWDAVRMLWLHGWFYYPFYTMATLHASLAVEMAIKERFEVEGIALTKGNSKFARRLDIAVARGWLVPHDFSNIRRRLERERESEELFAALGEGRAERSLEERNAELLTAMKRHLETLRLIRNDRAHPDGLSNVLPGMSYDEIEYARDLIAQLFPPSGP